MERYGDDYRPGRMRGERYGRDFRGYDGDFNRGHFARSGGRFGRGPGSGYMAGDRPRGGYGRRYDEGEPGWTGYRADRGEGFARRDPRLDRYGMDRPSNRRPLEGFGGPWHAPRPGDNPTGYDMRDSRDRDRYEGASYRDRYDRDFGDQLREGWRDLKRGVRDAFGGGYDRDHHRDRPW